MAKYNECFSEHNVLKCYCGRCFNELGTVEIEQTSSITMRSKNIKQKVLNDMVPKVEVLNTFKTKCDYCRDITEHFAVDSEIGDVIQMFNKLGMKTRFCCSGHKEDNSSMAYISFEDGELVKKVFYMCNVEFKYWKWTEDKFLDDDGNEYIVHSLRVDERNISLHDYVCMNHIEELSNALKDMFYIIRAFNNCLSDLVDGYEQRIAKEKENEE